MIFFLFAQLTPFIKWFYNAKEKMKKRKKQQREHAQMNCGNFLKPCNNFKT